VFLFYPSVLKTIIPHIKRTNLEIFRPRIILSSGEFLDNQTRKDTTDIFGTTPFRVYGTEENGRVGAECKCRDGIHIYTDFIVPEFIPVNKDDGSSPKRLILTNLHSFAMPFIRYDQEDFVHVNNEPCDCGMKFPRIRILESRPSDVIHLPNREVFSVLSLTGYILRLPGIFQFQIVQETIDQLLIRIVKAEHYSEAKTVKAVKTIGSLLPSVNVSLEIVQEIERDASGKFKQFKSRLL